MAESRDVDNGQQQSANLNADELEALQGWLTSYELPSLRSHKNLKRDFSDAVVLAELLKLEFPALVEIHNYSRCSGVQSKIDNWNMLHKRVLRKLNIHLKCDEIEKLARADANLIEAVLHRIMNQIQLVKSDNELSAALGESSIRRRGDSAGGDLKQLQQSKANNCFEWNVAEEISRRDSELEKLRNVVRKLQEENSMKNRQIEELRDRLAEKTSQKSMLSLCFESIRNSLNKYF